jgi:lysophospholipase L1-like esterase
MKRTSISRRRFIATAGLAGFTAGLTPRTALAENPVNSYEIPENRRGLTFLFQGDSITDGNWGLNGSSQRNYTDGNHILGHGYVFAIAARIGADFPRAGFNFHNRGMSGHSVSDLEKRWDTDTLALKPDVLSMLAGINDVAAVFHGLVDAYDAESFENRYRGLLQQCRDANPDMLFVLGTPFIYPVGTYREQWDFWSRETELRAEAVRTLAEEFDAVLVDYPKMFEKAVCSAPVEHWTWDGCHPTVAGHELMAREWIRQVAGKLTFLQQYGY